MDRLAKHRQNNLKKKVESLNHPKMMAKLRKKPTANRSQVKPSQRGQVSKVVKSDASAQRKSVTSRQQRCTSVVRTTGAGRAPSRCGSVPASRAVPHRPVLSKPVALKVKLAAKSHGVRK